jgi:hypothetical protein
VEGEISIEFENGRSAEFDEMVVLDLENGNWLRCVRKESSSRQGFPEITKYYRFEDDIDRIEIRPATE